MNNDSYSVIMNIYYCDVPSVNHTDSIVFHSQLSNRSVEVGGTASFECIYEGSRAIAICG